MDIVSHHMDGHCFTSYGWTLFHIIWMDIVSHHMDGQCFTSYGWTLFHIIWMGSVSHHMDGQDSVSHYVAGQFHVMWWIDTVLQCVDRQCFLSCG